LSLIIPPYYQATESSDKKKSGKRKLRDDETQSMVVEPILRKQDVLKVQGTKDESNKKVKKVKINTLPL
jgi:hypothetical protein